MRYEGLRIVAELRRYRAALGVQSTPVALTRGQIDQLCERGAIDFDADKRMWFEDQQVCELAPP